MNAKINTLLIVILFALAPVLYSQTQDGTVALKGVVSETTLLSSNDLHIWLQGEHGGSEVCLGSARFLDTQGFLPAVGDTIGVKGAHVGSGSLLVASSVQMGGKTLTLRRTSATQSCPDCGGHSRAHSDCGGYHHGCNRDHHGHCRDHE